MKFVGAKYPQIAPLYNMQIEKKHNNIDNIVIQLEYINNFFNTKLSYTCSNELLLKYVVILILYFVHRD